MFNWCQTGIEHVRHLTGRSADSTLLKKLTWLACNHDRRVLLVDTVRAFHFGVRFLVEIDIVLPEDMLLREAHDVGESLQNKVPVFALSVRFLVFLKLCALSLTISPI